MDKTLAQKTQPFAARLPLEAHALIHARAEAAGVSARAWLTDAILADKTKIVARQKPHPDLSRLVFQVNKAGNNLNQIAKRINELALVGELSHEKARSELDKLVAIEALLREAVAHAR